jgi:hypothetical protein
MTSGLSAKEHENLRAELHLRAVVPSLEDLVRWNPGVLKGFEEEDAIFALSFPEAKASTVRWSAHGLTTERKSEKLFSTDRAAMVTELRLRFWSARHVNRTFDGLTKFPPLPVGGWAGLGRSGEFEKLTEALRLVLEPSVGDLKDSTFLERHVLQNFSIALRSVRVLLSLDPTSRQLATQLPYGVYEFAVNTKHFGRVRWAIRREADKCDYFIPTDEAVPLVRLTFASAEVLYQLLNQKLDQMAAVAVADIKLEGLAPAADVMGLVLERVEKYLPMRQPKP